MSDQKASKDRAFTRMYRPQDGDFEIEKPDIPKQFSSQDSGSNHSRPGARWSGEKTAKVPAVSNLSPSWISSTFKTSTSVSSNKPRSDQDLNQRHRSFWEQYEGYLDLLNDDEPTTFASIKGKPSAQVAIQKLESPSSKQINHLDMLKKISHGNVQTMINILKDGQDIYVISEFARHSIAEIVTVTLKLDVDHIRTVAKAVLSAIVYLSSKNVMHGHISMEAIKVFHDGRVVLGHLEKSTRSPSVSSEDVNALGGVVVDMMNRGGSMDVAKIRKTRRFQEDCHLYIKDVSRWSKYEGLIEFVDALIQKDDSPKASYLQQYDFLKGPLGRLQLFVEVASFQCTALWIPHPGFRK